MSKMALAQSSNSYYRLMSLFSSCTITYTLHDKTLVLFCDQEYEEHFSGNGIRFCGNDIIKYSSLVCDA